MVTEIRMVNGDTFVVEHEKDLDPPGQWVTLKLRNPKFGREYVTLVLRNICSMTQIDFNIKE